MHMLIKKEVSEFEISMNDFPKTEVLQGIQDLEHKVSGFVLSQSPFSFY